MTRGMIVPAAMGKPQEPDPPKEEIQLLVKTGGSKTWAEKAMQGGPQAKGRAKIRRNPQPEKEG